MTSNSSFFIETKMVELPKKLTWIESGFALRASYGGGDYTVTIEQSDDDDNEYHFVFCKRNTDIAHNRETVTREHLESEMRKWERDLRKWHKVDLYEDAY